MIKATFTFRKRGVGFGFDFSHPKPDTDCTQWSQGEEVVIFDMQFRFAIAFLFWVLEVRTHRKIYEIECKKKGIKP